MNADDQGPGGEIRAPAAVQGARAISDILAALAARLPERQPEPQFAANDDPPRD